VGRTTVIGTQEDQQYKEGLSDRSPGNLARNRLEKNKCFDFKPKTQFLGQSYSNRRK
jgi:hypothetical protein